MANAPANNAKRKGLQKCALAEGHEAAKAAFCFGEGDSPKTKTPMLAGPPLSPIISPTSAQTLTESSAASVRWGGQCIIGA